MDLMDLNELIELILTNQYAGAIAVVIAGLCSMLFDVLKIRTSLVFILKILRALIKKILKRKEETMAEEEINIKRKVVRIKNTLISTETIEIKKTTVLGKEIRSSKKIIF